MTSFIIKAHEGRAIPEQWKTEPDCPFCQIIRDDAPAYRLYENDQVIAFLDILPLRPGHILVVPKTHYSRVSELPPEFAAAVGAAVSKVAHALTEALENTALNVVCNQDYAQAVPHVHYHIIPAPTAADIAKSSPSKVDHRVEPLSQKEMHRLEFEARDGLDDGAARILVAKIRAHL
ncbi:HIT-like protein [Wolfiporia cocos MD-104 SS10]|uniref:HIT-like protein n=1 Tax=Wolfiporia cocos (strain MD-104) TaxID=742152 RepID=A0A2H3JD87_WOLCO|nr:HIT-like protein [Wolfiporia cocos MD-104 SS10]